MSRGSAALALATALGQAPRPADTPAGDAAQDFVERELSARGWAPRRAPGPDGAVWACRPGSRSDRVLLLFAHTDSVPAGPGANDDAAAVGVLLTAASELGTPVRTTCLAFTDGEELGLRGSRRFAAEPELLPGEVDLAVSLELVGRGVLTWSGLGRAWDEHRLRALLDAVPAEVPYVYRAVSWRLPGLERSDHFWFGREGRPAALLLARGPRGFDPDYHTARDVPERLEERALEAAVGAVLALAAAPPLPGGGGADPAVVVWGVVVPGPGVVAFPWIALLAAARIVGFGVPRRLGQAAVAGLGGAVGLLAGPLGGWVGWFAGAALVAGLRRTDPAGPARLGWAVALLGAIGTTASGVPMLAVPFGVVALAVAVAPRLPSRARWLLAPLAGWPAFYFVRPNAVDELAFHDLVAAPTDGGLGGWALALAVLATPLLACQPSGGAAPGPRP